MPHRKRTRNGRPKGQLKTKERDDLSDVSMCSMTSEAPMSKDEIMTRLLEEFQFAGRMSSVCSFSIPVVTKNTTKININVFLTRLESVCFCMH